MKLKRALSLFLAAVMLATFAGCGGSGDSSQRGETSNSSNTSPSEREASETDDIYPEELVLPITEDNIELDLWTMYSGTIVSDLNEIEGVKRMEELTGVHINWIPIGQEELSDRFGILLASGDYPDIINPGSLAPGTMILPGGAEEGIEDGLIYDDMDTLIRRYMPDYMAYLNSSEEARREATSDNGKMTTVKCIIGQDFTAESEGTYQGLAYRKDILDELGINEPKTIDEWHTALEMAKESGIQYPLMIETNGSSPLSLAWGVNIFTNFIQLEGNKVVGSAAEEGFAQYLETMKNWYAEGLIDPNFTAFNFYLDTPSSVENNEKLLYSTVLSSFAGQNYYNMNMITNESAFLQPVTAPVLEEGEEPIQSGERVIAGDMIFISASCEEPVIAAKWLDFLYTREGELCLWYGIEGQTYEIDEDGEPQLLESIITNPDGLAPGDYLQKFALNRGSCWLGKNNWEASAKLNRLTSGNNTQQEAVDIWNSPTTNISYPLRGVSLTQEENDLISVKSTSINTYITEYMVNYIIGTDETAPADFQATLNGYGYQEIIDAYQAAYDRYLAR